jgi:hypothetical protein
MKIGNLEIKWVLPKNVTFGQPVLFDPAKLQGAFAVPDTAPWWLAVHAVIDELEQEWIQGARESVGNTNLCINSLGISEGVASVRRRLIETRNEVLRAKEAA